MKKHQETWPKSNFVPLEANMYIKITYFDCVVVQKIEAFIN